MPLLVRFHVCAILVVDTWVEKDKKAPTHGLLPQGVPPRSRRVLHVKRVRGSLLECVEGTDRNAVIRLLNHVVLS